MRSYMGREWVRGQASIAWPYRFTNFPVMVTHSRSNKVIRKGITLVWNATLWVLWNVRNGKIFETKDCAQEEVIEKIKVVSWKWFLSRMAKSSCL